ncbi:hypothetical protein CEXT_617291 [Caerostris extrusa]|uniref:Uncharacterized protein n=1 Tax=Caerostris extrusa TaxID=172846 RepID=A0AAV4QV97_CAEEX|nr:hypothetical protein CEXT_617291 [Caerostris extrusa]
MRVQSFSLRPPRPSFQNRTCFEGFRFSHRQSEEDEQCSGGRTVLSQYLVLITIRNLLHPESIQLSGRNIEGGRGSVIRDDSVVIHSEIRKGELIYLGRRKRNLSE